MSLKKMVVIPSMILFATLSMQCQDSPAPPENGGSGGGNTGGGTEEPDLPVPEKVIPKFVHSTYIVGNRLASQKEVDESNYGKFSFMYMNAPPAWAVADFDRDETWIMNKYIKNFSYPAGTSGESLVPKVITKAHTMGTKVLISLPGAENIYQIANNASRRSKFAKMMAQFVKKFDYDGIEVDWEGDQVTVNLHTTLMTAIRSELNLVEKKMGRALYLTTALAEWRGYNRDQAIALSKQVDWINIMTYDMGGGVWGSTPDHNTPLNVMKSRMESNFQHFAPSKICIGLANYGYFYRDLKPGVNVGRDVVVAQSRDFGYTSVPGWIAEGWTEQWDATAQAPYYFSPDGTDFFTIDNLRSLDLKIEWIVQKKFLGEFWWVFNCDYFPPKAGEKYGTNYMIDHVEKRYKELVK